MKRHGGGDAGDGDAGDGDAGDADAGDDGGDDAAASKAAEDAAASKAAEEAAAKEAAASKAADEATKAEVAARAAADEADKAFAEATDKAAAASAAVDVADPADKPAAIKAASDAIDDALAKAIAVKKATEAAAVADKAAAEAVARAEAAAEAITDKTCDSEPVADKAAAGRAIANKAAADTAVAALQAALDKARRENTTLQDTIDKDVREKAALDDGFGTPYGWSRDIDAQLENLKVPLLKDEEWNTGKFRNPLWHSGSSVPKYVEGRVDFAFPTGLWVSVKHSPDEYLRQQILVKRSDAPQAVSKFLAHEEGRKRNLTPERKESLVDIDPDDIEIIMAASFKWVYLDKFPITYVLADVGDTRPYLFSRSMIGAKLGITQLTGDYNDFRVERDQEPIHTRPTKHIRRPIRQ